MEDKVKILLTVSEELLGKMSTSVKVEVSYEKEAEAYVVNIDAGDETGLLIGKKGETLLSIQTVLGFLFKQKVGEWNRVMVNVGDYREKEESYLKDLAASTAARAKETGEPQSLYNLKAWQRRVVHMTLSEDKDIETVSEGEGEDRYLIVKSKK
jgi:spoIIIJ-associated protein